MKRIDLAKIIRDRNIDAEDLAKVLFDTGDPKRSLKRVTDGISVLDANQISALSNYTGLPIGLLFDGDSWAMQSGIEDGKTVMRFMNYDYEAKLYVGAMVVELYCKGEIFHTKSLRQKSLEISEYLSILSDLIIKHK